MSAEALAKEKKGVGGRNPSATLRTSFLLALAFAASFFADAIFRANKVGASPDYFPDFSR